MPPTMQDVARVAGVSPSTVSLAMNNKPGVSPETRDLVLQVAEELGYELVKGSSKQVTLAPPAIAVAHYAYPGDNRTVAPVGLPTQYISGIQNYARAEDASLTLVANYVETDAYHIGHSLLNAKLAEYDGLILIHCPSKQSGLITQALDSGRPVVVIARHWPDVPVSSVGHDHPQQASVALDYLLGLGHRRIAFLAREGLEDYQWFKIRLDIYRRTMEGLGCWDERRVAIGPEGGQTALELLERCPDTTAIWAINDADAVPALRALCDAGIRVPDQISILGMDDSVQSPEGYPALTTVAVPAQLVGYLAARTLAEHIRNQDLAYSRIFVRSWLITRDSTAPPES